MSWTPLETRPLHAGAEPHQVWACRDPDRPVDVRTCWDYRCRACALHALGALVNRDASDGFAVVVYGPADALATHVVNRRKLVVVALREIHGVRVST